MSVDSSQLMTKNTDNFTLLIICDLMSAAMSSILWLTVLFEREISSFFALHLLLKISAMRFLLLCFATPV
ncbi:unnamed protein product [Acanthoscelides obtectus]|uniref:Uncharacterized protein n=1 Tax=Acanthoscelides obtectus TaxID=200917 RepID=A0A9P0JQT0_ACAOB|nr:unnamed protein product [Acanthoscelides obtectus]CAK1661863.1 hypothetical protein AOBTE_LOCUS22840 [Acanthoscelides obtectus]